MATKQFDEAVEGEKKLFKSKEYLAKLSKDKNGNNVATKTETLKRILTMIDEKGLESTICDLGVPSFWIDEIIKNREGLEQGFKLVLIQ